METQVQLLAILGFYLNVWWNLPQKSPYNAAELKQWCVTQGRGQAWLLKNAVQRYYGFVDTNLWPKTSNCFISLAFFQKIPPVLVNK